MGRILSEKKGGTGLVSEKTEVYTQNLTKERKQPPVVILEQAILYSIFILCLCLRFIGTSNQDAQFMNFPSQIFFNYINHGYRAAILKKNSLWLLPFYMVWLLLSIMKRCAERCILQLYQTSLNNEVCFFVDIFKFLEYLHTCNMVFLIDLMSKQGILSYQTI